MTTRNERLREIGKIISDAMRKAGVDWSRSSPEISKASYELDEAMADYADGKVTKPVVQSRYKVWRDLHKTGVSA